MVPLTGLGPSWRGVRTRARARVCVCVCVSVIQLDEPARIADQTETEEHYNPDVTPVQRINEPQSSCTRPTCPNLSLP